MANTSLDPIDILLEMGFDLDDISDDESYLSAMKEAIATIDFQTKGAGDERTPVLQGEVIKLRRKRSPRTSPAKQKANKIFGVKPKATPRTTSGTKLLEASKEQDEKKQTNAEAVSSALTVVSTSINGITNLLKQDLKFEEKQAEAERQAAIDLQRDNAEKESEKEVKNDSKSFLKGIKPPKIPFFERIKKFFTNVALGSLLGWLTKEENKDKIDGFFNFLEKYGGLIIGGFIALLAADIGLKIIGFVGSLITVGTALLPLIKVIAAAALAAGIIGGTAQAVNYLADTKAEILGGGTREITETDEDGTSTTTRYNFADMEAKEKELQAILMSRRGTEEQREAVRQRLEKVTALLNRMRQTKTQQSVIKSLQEQIDLGIKKDGEEFKSSESYKLLTENLKKAQTNYEQSLKIETKMFKELNFDPDTISLQRFQQRRAVPFSGIFDREAHAGMAEIESKGKLGAYDPKFSGPEMYDYLLEEVVELERKSSEKTETPEPTEPRYGSGMTQAEVDAAILESTKKGGMYEGYDPSQLEFDHELEIPTLKANKELPPAAAEQAHLEATPPPFREPTSEDLKSKEQSPEQRESMYSTLQDSLRENDRKQQELMETLRTLEPQAMESVTQQVAKVQAAAANRSGSSTSQKEVTAFSPINLNNIDSVAVAGIYNSPVRA